MSSLPCMDGIKVIFTDLDNTLWMPQSRIVPRRNIETLQKLQSLGIPVIPVTGRSLNACHRAIYRNGLYDLKLYPGIYCDGAIIYDEKGQITHSNFLPNDVVAKVRDIVEPTIRRNEGVIGYFCHNALKATDLKSAVELYAYPNHSKRQHVEIGSSSHDIREVTNERKHVLEELTTETTRSSEEASSDPSGSHIGSPRTPWDDNIELLPDDLTNEKVVYFYVDGKDHLAIVEKIKAIIGTDNFDYCHQNPRYTVIRNLGCDKYAAIRIMMDKNGWKEEECLIMGDGDNDVCMLRGFKNTVVMKDGYESALAAGKYMSEYNASDGGWGHSIATILKLDTV